MMLARELRYFHLSAFMCLISLGGALYVQFGLGIYPCAWCALMRVIFVFIFFVCWAATLVNCPVYRRVAAVVGVLISLWGVGTGLYSYFVASVMASCENSFASHFLGTFGFSRLSGLFGSFGPCQRTPFLGVDMSLWATLVYLLCLICMVLQFHGDRDRPF